MHMKKKGLFIKGFASVSLFLLVVIQAVYSQQYHIYINPDFSYDIDKALYAPGNSFHTSVRPYIYQDVNKIIDIDSVTETKKIHRNFKGKFWNFVWNKAFNDHVVNIKRKDFSFIVDPLLHFEFDKEFGTEGTKYINTRGFQVYGTIGKQVGFFTSFYENQARFVEYVDNFIRRTGVVPGQGKVSTIKPGEYDFASATGYLSYSPSKYFNFQFGHGKNFWGDGYRSLLLSDNAFNYPFLKFTTDFWKIKYVVMYAQFQDLDADFSAELGYLKKYGTLHYLSMDLTKRLNFSLFEAIIWEAQDTTGQQRGLEINYLNPIIFLRPVEFSLGSPDNALLGFNLSYRIARHNTVYAQILLDEFRLKEVIAGDGWWGNKQALQLGVKSFELFKIHNLYFQTELNYIRPYTYAHWKTTQAYGHYNQPLAHPIGANVVESVNFLKYHYKRWYFNYEFQYAVYGEDKDGRNYGRNIFESYNNRVSDDGNYVGQGLRTNLLYNNFRASYLLNPSNNLNISLGITHRNLENDLGSQNDLFIYVSLRTPFENNYYDY